MDSDSISAMCSIPTNTDISGVGVRAAVYFTMFCRVFLTSLASPQLASETRTATQVLSLCIVLAALVSAGMHTMSLPHAMVASNLISVTIWPVFVVEPMKESSPQSFWLGKLRYLAYMVLK